MPPGSRATGPRVIAGTARGVELRAPKGGRTRPTTGRLREALFAMLDAAGVSFDRVLDLYAGSGALGIEALSRGDGEATFVESDRRAAALIRENLTRARLEDRGTVVVASVGRWRRPDGAAYTLVLADPPYDRGTYDGREGGRSAAPGQRAAPAAASPWQAIAVTVQDALAAEAAVVVEHDARSEPPAMLAGLPLWRDRRHGAGAVAIYRDAPAGTGHEGVEQSAPASRVSGDVSPGTDREGIA